MFVTGVNPIICVNDSGENVTCILRFTFRACEQFDGL